MERIAAKSLDRRAKARLVEHRRLVVHSVFERAVNLESAPGDLTALLGPRGCNGPATVLLARAPVADFRRLLARGEVVLVGPGPAFQLGRSVSVDLAGAALWTPPARLLTSPERLERSCQVAVDWALRRGPRGGLAALLPLVGRPIEPAGDAQALPKPDDPFIDRATSALVELIAGWRRVDAGLVQAAAGRLCGLGPGQTPSGDDLLAGLMVASRPLACDGRPAEVMGWHGALCRLVVSAAAGRTTDLGMERLRYAAEGELDERSHHVLTALAGDDMDALRNSVAELAAYGHTSGIDTLVGLLAGRWLIA